MSKLNPSVTNLPFIRVALHHSLLVVCSFFPMPLAVHREPYTPRRHMYYWGPRKAERLYGEEEQPSKKFKFVKLKHIAKVVTKVKLVHNKKTVKTLLSFYVLEYFYIPYRLYPRSNAFTFTSRNFSGTVDFNASIHFS